MKNNLVPIKFANSETEKGSSQLKRDYLFFRKESVTDIQKRYVSLILHHHCTPRWKKKYLNEGIDGLKDKYKRVEPEKWLWSIKMRFFVVS